MSWNLSIFPITLLFLNQSMTLLHPNCKMSISAKIISAKADSVLSLQKILRKISDTKENKSFINRLKSIDPNIEC